MNAAGTLGFAPDYRAPAPWEAFGAFVTNPLSLRTRRPTAQPALIEYPGGYHEPHNDIHHPQVMADVERWLAQRLNPDQMKGK